VTPKAPSNGHFISGLELSRLFYEEAVQPIVARHFPHLAYGVGRLEAGSEVLGFDTPRSMDHGWGMHLTLFLTQTDWTRELAEEESATTS
jgi:hypothetical protein